jgi:dolichyl-diphosphooligosaccharide--protein glycosyltransferase/undecaprenyl-diphosphooligosaccharide--protein glycosyltransferase
MQKGLIQESGRNIPIHKMVITQTMKNGYLKNMSREFHKDAPYSIVYMRDYNTMAVMDNKTFKSTYVQMFMLEHFDNKLFELVVHSPYTKIYRLKK